MTHLKEAGEHKAKHKAINTTMWLMPTSRSNVSSASKTTKARAPAACYGSVA